MKFYNIECNTEIRRGELFYLVYNFEKLQQYLSEQNVEKVSKMIEKILQQLRCIFEFLKITEEKEEKYIDEKIRQGDGLLMVPELLLEAIKLEMNKNKNDSDRLYYYLVNVKRDFINLYNLLIQDPSKKIN